MNPPVRKMLQSTSVQEDDTFGQEEDFSTLYVRKVLSLLKLIWDLNDEDA